MKEISQDIVKGFAERNFQCNAVHTQVQGVPRGREAAELQLLSDQQPHYLSANNSINTNDGLFPRLAASSELVK